MMLKAFTLIETLVAIAIICIVIVGPFNIAQGVLQNSFLARDEMIATTLAQEGIEYAREIRDSNFLYNNDSNNASDVSWLNGLDAAPTDCYNNACTVDVGQQAIAQCSGACQALYLSASNLYNQQQSGKQTQFTRTVRLTSISATETLVTVTVTWNYHGVHSVILKETLRKWL